MPLWCGVAYNVFNRTRGGAGKNSSRTVKDSRSMSGPKFSIIIPTRNGQRYLAEALQSALAQTYSCFTIFVLESGSEDRTVDIVRSFNSDRIRLLPDPEPLGIEANWARILDLDLDEYMTILGHDDLLHPDFLQKIADLIRAYPDASLYQTHFDLIGPTGNVLRRCKPIPLVQSADEFLLSRHTFAQDSFATGYVMKSADYKAIGGFPVRLPRLIGADDLAWYALASLAYKVCSPETCFGYRYHTDSTSYSIDLYTVYRAYRIYLASLEQTTYFAQPEHRRAAHRYFQKSLNGRHHRLLADLIKTGTPERWQRYEQDKRQLLREAGETPVFKVYDGLARLLERIARLPVPLRRGLISLIERVGAVTQRVRKGNSLRSIRPRGSSDRPSPFEKSNAPH